MVKTKTRAIIFHEDRACIAGKFNIGDLVRHIKTGRTGQIQETCNELAIPLFWVIWQETETELKTTEQADPLDLELLQPHTKVQDIFPLLLEEQFEDEGIELNPAQPEIMLGFEQNDEMIDESFPSALLQTAAGVATPSIDSPRSNMNNFTSGATTVGRDESVAADSVASPQAQGTLETEADDINESERSTEQTPTEQPPEESLTPDEIADRHRLELQVERSFYQAGSALRELRDRRLYRSSYKTFEDYSQHRFGYTRSYCNYLIKAADSYDNLKMATNSCQKLPTKETQIRPLTSLEPDEQRQVWEEAVEEAGNRVPSARVVKQVVLRHKGVVEDLKKKNTPPCSDTYRPGQVFEIYAKSGWLRKFDGCWAIAKAVNNFSLEVEVYSEVLTQVKPENLTPIDSPQECREITVIAERVRRLRESGLLDAIAYTILGHIGKKTYLSDSEEEHLAMLENRHLSAQKND